MAPDDKRRQILAAARTVFARDGFHLASMHDICQLADMSPGSVYRYFRGKADIIAAMVDDSRDGVSASFAELAESADVVTGLSGLVDRLLADLTDPTERSLYFESTAEAFRNPRVAEAVRGQDAEAIALLTAALRRGQAAGQIDATLDPTFVAHILSAVVDGLTWRKFLDPDVHTPAYASTVRTLLNRFLRPSSHPTGVVR